MTRNEVIVKAIEGKITWIQAAMICGITARHMRRLKESYQERGYDGLVDHRGGRPRRKRIPMKTIEALCKLKREKYADFSVQHFWEKATEEHGIAISYTWARLALQAAGLVEKSPGRGRYRRVHWNQRIQVFDWNGTFLFQIKDAPPLSSPRGIFARDGRIYLADSGNGVGRVFDRSGKLLLTLGERGRGPGQLSEPVDILADSKGRVYILNSGNNRMEIFAPSGEPAGSFPIPNWTGPHLKESYLAIDAGNVIYMSDWDSGRVRRFKTSGTELPMIGPTVSRPSGLIVEGTRVVLAARGDNRVRAALVK